eukprot:g30754.t1
MRILTGLCFFFFATGVLFSLFLLEDLEESQEPHLPFTYSRLRDTPEYASKNDQHVPTSSFPSGQALSHILLEDYGQAPVGLNKSKNNSSAGLVGGVSAVESVTNSSVATEKQEASLAEAASSTSVAPTSSPVPVPPRDAGPAPNKEPLPPLLPVATLTRHKSPVATFLSPIGCASSQEKTPPSPSTLFPSANLLWPTHGTLSCMPAYFLLSVVEVSHVSPARASLAPLQTNKTKAEAKRHSSSDQSQAQPLEESKSASEGNSLGPDSLKRWGSAREDSSETFQEASSPPPPQSISSPSSTPFSSSSVAARTHHTPPYRFTLKQYVRPAAPFFAPRLEASYVDSLQEVHKLWRQLVPAELSEPAPPAGLSKSASWYVWLPHRALGLLSFLGRAASALASGLVNLWSAFLPWPPGLMLAWSFRGLEYLLLTPVQLLLGSPANSLQSPQTRDAVEGDWLGVSSLPLPGSQLLSASSGDATCIAHTYSLLAAPTSTAASSASTSWTQREGLSSQLWLKLSIFYPLPPSLPESLAAGAASSSFSFPSPMSLDIQLSGTHPVTALTVDCPSQQAIAQYLHSLELTSTFNQSNSSKSTKNSLNESHQEWLPVSVVLSREHDFYLFRQYRFALRGEGVVGDQPGGRPVVPSLDLHYLGQRPRPSPRRSGPVPPAAPLQQQQPGQAAPNEQTLWAAQQGAGPVRLQDGQHLQDGSLRRQEGPDGAVRGPMADKFGFRSQTVSLQPLHVSLRAVDKASAKGQTQMRAGMEAEEDDEGWAGVAHCSPILAVELHSLLPQSPRTAHRPVSSLAANLFRPLHPPARPSAGSSGGGQAAQGGELEPGWELLHRVSNKWLQMQFTNKVAFAASPGNQNLALGAAPFVVTVDKEQTYNPIEIINLDPERSFVVLAINAEGTLLAIVDDRNELLLLERFSNPSEPAVDGEAWEPGLEEQNLATSGEELDKQADDETEDDDEDWTTLEETGAQNKLRTTQKSQEERGTEEKREQETGPTDRTAASSGTGSEGLRAHRMEEGRGAMEGQKVQMGKVGKWQDDAGRSFFSLADPQYLYQLLQPLLTDFHQLLTELLEAWLGGSAASGGLQDEACDAVVPAANPTSFSPAPAASFPSPQPELRTKRGHTSKRQRQSRKQRQQRKGDGQPGLEETEKKFQWKDETGKPPEPGQMVDNEQLLGLHWEVVLEMSLPALFRKLDILTATLLDIAPPAAIASASSPKPDLGTAPLPVHSPQQHPVEPPSPVAPPLQPPLDMLSEQHTAKPPPPAAWLVLVMETGVMVCIDLSARHAVASPLWLYSDVEMLHWELVSGLVLLLFFSCSIR